MTAERWVDLILELTTLPRAARMVPPKAVAPSWHALAILEAAGHTVFLTDPLIEAAKWEWLAFAAESLLVPDAPEFAARCRAIADDCWEGAAA